VFGGQRVRLTIGRGHWRGRRGKHGGQGVDRDPRAERQPAYEALTHDIARLGRAGLRNGGVERRSFNTFV